MPPAMRCNGMHETLSAYIDRELTDEEMLAAASHLESCECCRRFVRLEQETKRLVKRCAGCEAPAGLRESIRELLDRECGMTR